MPVEELSFVEWLRVNNPAHRSIELGIGDDMGAVRVSGGCVLLSSDLLLDGVHVDSRVHSFERIGRKALARNLSDCAAMVVRPICATVSVAFPRNTEAVRREDLFRGIWRLASEFGVGIIGGDTAAWDHPLCVDIAILAEPLDGITPVTRAGARAGDRLLVTGPLGGSILGRHLDFTPRLREAEVIARSLGEKLHAMIDVSDGLSLDLWRLCQASGVGAELDEVLLERVTSDAARSCALRDADSSLTHVLTDGEDYELLMAVDESGDLGSLPVFPIGRIAPSDNGISLRTRLGDSEPIRPGGYTHS